MGTKSKKTFKDIGLDQQKMVDIFNLLENQNHFQKPHINHTNLYNSNFLPSTEREVRELTRNSIDTSEELMDELKNLREVYKEGGFLEINFNDGYGSITALYGPKTREPEVLLSGVLYMDGPVQGTAIEDRHIEIIRENPAPYLETGYVEEEVEGLVKGSSIGKLRIPAEYSQDELSETYDKVVERFNTANDLQNFALETIYEFES